MRKAVIGMLVMLVLLCARTQTLAHFEPPSLEPPLGQTTNSPTLEEAELESELANNDSESSLASDFSEIETQLAAEIENIKREASYALVRVKYTAYYGPRPNQGDYAHGSYAKDVAINGAGKLTAYGTKPRYGIVATDPRVFPRGTKLLLVDPLDGKEKIFVAEDKGSDIKGHWLDFFTGFGKKGLARARKIHRKGEYMIVKVITSSPARIES